MRKYSPMARRRISHMDIVRGIVEYHNKHPAQIETEHECDKSEVLYLMPIARISISMPKSRVCAFFLPPLPYQTCSICHFGVAGFGACSLLFCV